MSLHKAKLMLLVLFVLLIQPHKNLMGHGRVSSLVQPNYAVWSACIAYDINPQLNIALNLNNIFDKNYYSTIGYPGYGNFYCEPRNFLLTLKASY